MSTTTTVTSTTTLASGITTNVTSSSGTSTLFSSSQATATFMKNSLSGLSKTFSMFQSKAPSSSTDIEQAQHSSITSGFPNNRSRSGIGSWNTFESGNNQQNFQSQSQSQQNYSYSQQKQNEIVSKSPISAQLYQDIDEDEMNQVVKSNQVDYNTNDSKYMYDDYTENDYIATGDIISKQTNYNNNYTSSLTTMQSSSLASIPTSNTITQSSSTYVTNTYDSYTDENSILNNQIGKTTIGPTTINTLPEIPVSQQTLTNDKSNYYCDNIATTNVAYNLTNVQQTDDESNKIDNSNYLRDCLYDENYLESSNNLIFSQPVNIIIYSIIN